MKILILGNGLLGSQIHQQTGWDIISRKSHPFFDFDSISTYKDLLPNYDVILNCVANTSTYTNNYDAIIKTNYEAVMDLVDECNRLNIKLVHISTDYVYAGSDKPAKEDTVPVHANTWYSYSKLIADAYIQSRGIEYLLVRCSHKPNPFPYKKAITTQIGNFDYADVIAGKIVALINHNAAGVYNVGTDTKTVYDLAIRTADVERCNDLINKNMPTDIRMCCYKMEKKLND